MERDLTPTPRPLVTGHLTAKDISITVRDVPLELPEDVEAMIEKLWKEKTLEAQVNDLNLFNGTSYRLTDWRHEDGVLHLTFSIFDFKHRLGLITFIREGRIPESDFFHGGCAVGATVITNDNKYVVVKLTGKSMNQNAYDLPGGIMDTDTPCTSGQYVFDMLNQELEEEVCVEPGDIERSYLRMMYAGINGHCPFYCEVILNISSDELQEKFKHNKDVDIDSLCFYDFDGYIQMLEAHNANKQLIAKLLQGQV